MEKYRFSRYNHFLKRKAKIVGINLYSKQLFAIDQQKYDLLLSNKSDLNKLQIDEPVLFNTMYKLGIIEDAETDIPTILLMKNREQVFAKSSYRLFINPTLNCNFSCWYCCQTHSKKKMSKEVLENTKKHINHIVENTKTTQLHIDWFGGEPLLCYETVIKPLVIATKEICTNHKKDFFITMTTNGFLIRPEMIPFFEENNFRCFQITLDGYKEKHNQIRFPKDSNDNSYDVIVQNICLLTSSPLLYVTLRVNYTKETISYCTHIINSFPAHVRKKIRISLVQVFQDSWNNTNMDRENIVKQYITLQNVFKKAGFNMGDPNFEKEKYHTCFADLNNEALINYDGRVFKCTAVDFEKVKEDGVLNDQGEIIWDENILAKRIARSTFDNKECLKCDFLPICTGSCSVKTFMVEGRKTKCTIKLSLKKKLYDKMETFYHQDYKLAHLFEL